MNLNEIQVGLKSGALILDKDKVYSLSEWEAITNAEKMAEHYDLLQLTKKIQL